MRVLVTGGRDYRNARTILNVLSILHAETPIDTIIHGGAGGCDLDGLYGADVIAQDIAEQLGIDTQVYVPDWKAHGKKAGPIRNQLMLDDGKPNLVVAFPGGKGTADMVRRANAAGVMVILAPRTPPRDLCNE